MSSLNRFLRQNEKWFFRAIVSDLGKQPQKTPYIDFLRKSEEGRRRIRYWIDLIVRALEGDAEPLFDDQTEIGYVRAMQGYRFSQTSVFYPVALKVLNQALADAGEGRSIDVFSDYRRLMEYYLQAYRSISNSYLNTREEIIYEKIFHLEELSAFTKEIISSQNIDGIVETLLRKMDRILETGTCYFLLSRSATGRKVYGPPSKPAPEPLLRFMEKSYAERSPLFQSRSGRIVRDIAKVRSKKRAAFPLYLRGQSYGVFTITGNGVPLKFEAKELDILSQFLYITVIALDNAFMFEEIEQNHRQLRFLTEKIINIQEEERKRLASDIHDSLAQTLAVVGYKIDFCKEHVRRPELLADQLDTLTGIVNNAIVQSRQLISALQPELIDIVGLVAAVRRLIDHFRSETGIPVDADLPEKIDAAPSTSICIYRVLQEALKNIHKHAPGATAGVVLRKRGKKLLLTVFDDGQGFDLSSGLLPMADQNKLGLIFMKGRVEAAGGAFAILTGPCKGCRIEVSIPLERGKEEK